MSSASVGRAEPPAFGALTISSARFLLGQHPTKIGWLRMTRAKSGRSPWTTAVVTEAQSTAHGRALPEWDSSANP
jgi:hypothetical protein